MNPLEILTDLVHTLTMLAFKVAMNKNIFNKDERNQIGNSLATVMETINAARLRMEAPEAGEGNVVHFPKIPRSAE